MILRQRVAACLFDPLPAEFAIRTAIQYSITFCDLQEVDNEVISGVVVDDVGLDISVKFCCSTSKIS